MQKLVQFALIAAGTLFLVKFGEKKNPKIQARFEQFHEKIRLGEKNEKAKLREKREVILEALRLNLASNIPRFDYFLQGSYAMHTGTFPLGGDYDIDVGLIFDAKRTNYDDPVALKVAVRDALKRSARKVKIRNSCVTVHYVREGEPEYHVDLAVYVKRNDGLLDIAKGKEFAKSEYRFWEQSDPNGLIKAVCTRFRGDDLRQYRRCVRYVKRWRDVQFAAGTPTSIALTVMAYHWFRPERTLGGTPIDLVALTTWVKSLLNEFRMVTTAEGKHLRLQVLLPVEPKVDLLAKMTRIQMAQFQKTLTSLHTTLLQASEQSKLEDSLDLLSKQFGSEFYQLP